MPQSDIFICLSMGEVSITWRHRENECLQECRRARVQVHPTHFSLLFLSFSSAALSSFWLFQLITCLEVSPAFGVTVKMAPCISQYSHRESHHLHQAMFLCLKPQENSPSASPSIKVYVMPALCKGCQMSRLSLAPSPSAHKSVGAFVGFSMWLDWHGALVL